MVMTGAKEMLQVTRIGTIRVVTSTGQMVLLTNVILVPKLAASLTSLAKLLHVGMHIEGKGNTVRIHDCSKSILNFVLKEDMFQQKEAEKATVLEKIALVHINICGPFHTSRHGYKYFASITDDATRYRWILLIKSKDEIIPKFQEWLPYAEVSRSSKRSTHITMLSSLAMPSRTSSKKGEFT